MDNFILLAVGAVAGAFAFPRARKFYAAVCGISAQRKELTAALNAMADEQGSD